MKILVYHASKYGNGQKVAEAIADGAKAKGAEAKVLHAKEAKTEAPASYDLLVFGSPHRAGRPQGKVKKAVKLAGKAAAGKPFTVFTTHMDKPTAHSTLDSLAIEAGLSKAHDGTDFKVTGMKGPLEDGAEDKARSFGEELAGLSL